MNSKIAAALGLKYAPIAVLWTDERPEEAREFKPGKWGCVMWMLASAARGKTAVFSADTYGCWGGGVGLGFGNQYLKFPGGLECFYHFLSTGNDQWEEGRQTAAKIKDFVSRDFMDDFLKGERYFKTPEAVKEFVDGLPMREPPAKYVVFKPLEAVDPEAEPPEVVVLLAPPDQLAALVILANYGRPGIDNVTIPYAAGCQTIGILAYQEAMAERPRAVVGLTDISARKNLKKQLDRDLFTFTIPWKMFLEMEAEVEGSFLQRRTWQSLIGNKK